jgi:phosphatidylserine/phosphatidylglycerophosphate/cardiolipin synthase-like enzyme
MNLRKSPSSVFGLILLTIFVGGCGGQIKSIPPEIYFSPDRHIQNRIITAVDGSNASIDLAIFDFTSQEIKLALEQAKARGVTIRIVADSRQAKGVHSIIPALIDEGFNVKIMHGKARGIMHNKFTIFDKKLLFTGSYNWTNNAEHNNYENAIFIRDQAAIDKYQREFEELWSASPNKP